MFELEPGEQIIKKTRPHSASFLSSPWFWIGSLIFAVGFVDKHLGGFARILSLVVGVGLIGFAHIRRIDAYTLYFTDRRLVSSYSFVRKAYREIYYDKMFEVKIIQGPFGRIAGYADLWLYGYQQTWVVGRMRGVRIGDCQIVIAKAWREKIKNIPQT